MSAQQSMEQSTEDTKEGWKDCGRYWLSLADQRTEDWFLHRKGRITASSIHSSAYYPESYLFQLANPQEPDERSKQRMQHGVITEPEARQWYEKYTGYQVQEVGLMVPKFDLGIGGSPDGLVNDDGLLEIKCPQQPYACLQDPSLNQRDATPDSHYSQIQTCLAISGRSWCDYLVYCTNQQQVFLRRIYPDPDWWLQLYSKVQDTYQRHPEIHLRVDPC